MDGLLSPDGKQVMHESKWITAIISPDGRMYFYEGKWYKLVNTVKTNRDRINEPIQRSPIRTSAEERTSKSIDKFESRDVLTKQIIAGFIAIFLVWYVFIDGEISNWDLATEVDCSALSDPIIIDFFGNLEEECEEEVFVIRFKIFLSFIVILSMVSYIFNQNKELAGVNSKRNSINYIEYQQKLREGREKHLTNKKEIQLRLEKQNNRERIERKRNKQINYYEKRIKLTEILTKKEKRLSLKNLDFESRIDEWNNILKMVEKEYTRFKNTVLINLLIIILISTTFLSLQSLDILEVDLVLIFLIIFIYTLTSNAKIIYDYKSIKYTEKDNQTWKLSKQIPILKRQILELKTKRENLDRGNNNSGNKLKLDLEIMKRKIGELRNEEYN